MSDKKSPLDIAEELIVIGTDHPTTEVQTRLIEAQKKMLREGMHNGSNGIKVKEEIKLRTENQASTVQEELTTLIAKKLTELKTRITFVNNEKSTKYDMHQRIQRDISYQKIIKFHSNTSNGKFTTYSFLGIGLFLILADIVIALQLIQVGFAFETPVQKYSLENLFSTNFFYVLQFNWQVLVIAIGISFLTIPLKLSFDRFIGSPYGYAHVRKNNFERWFFDNKDDISLDFVGYMRWIKRFERIKNTVLLIICGITIIFIFLMAQFRSIAIEEIDLIKQYESKVEKFSKMTLEQSAKLAEEHKEQLLDLRKHATSNRMTVFFLITLLFPIVAAMSLSITGAARENKRKIRELQDEIDSAWQLLHEKEKEMEDMQATQAAWALEEAIINKDTWKSGFAMKLFDNYNYGYKIGSIRPDLFQVIPDLFESIDSYRNKLVLFNTNNKLSQFNS